MDFILPNMFFFIYKSLNSGKNIFITSNMASSSKLFLLIRIAMYEKNNKDDTIEPMLASTPLILG